VKRAGVVSSILMLTSGCVVVGGYSSERGWYLWPGTIVIFLVFAVIFLIFRRASEFYIPAVRSRGEYVFLFGAIVFEVAR
jgi:hypothetical protein